MRTHQRCCSVSLTEACVCARRGLTAGQWIGGSWGARAIPMASAATTRMVDTPKCSVQAFWRVGKIYLKCHWNVVEIYPGKLWNVRVCRNHRSERYISVTSWSVSKGTFGLKWSANGLRMVSRTDGRYIWTCTSSVSCTVRMYCASTFWIWTVIAVKFTTFRLHSRYIWGISRQCGM